MNALLSKLLKNRYVMGLLGMLLGATATAIFLPPKEEVHVETRTEARAVTNTERNAQEAVRIQESLQERRREARVIERTVRTASGTVTEERITESLEAELQAWKQVERLKLEAELQQRAAELERQYERKAVSSWKRRTNVFLGVDPRDAKRIYGGATYNIWGPVGVGFLAGSGALFMPVLSVRF